MYRYVHGRPHVLQACVWRLEDNFWELVLGIRLWLLWGWPCFKLFHHQREIPVPSTYQ